MEVREVLNSKHLKAGDNVEVTGWLVDRYDGLFILGAHLPEDYDYPERIRIINGNVMYLILKSVSSLVGGKSKLFYKARIVGNIAGNGDGIIVKELYTQDDRNSTEFFKVEINEELVKELVAQHGNYQFEIQKPSARDWLEDC